MKWFLNLTTRSKLGIGFGLMCALLLIVIFSANFGLSTIMAAQQRLYEHEFANAQDLLDVRQNMNGERASLLAMMLVKQSEQAIWLEDIKRRSEMIGKKMEQLLERNRGDAFLTERLSRMETIGKAFRKARDTTIIPLINGGKLEEAQALIISDQEMRYLERRELARELGDLTTARAREATLDSEGLASQIVSTINVIGFIAILLGAVLVQFFDRIISVPLKTVSAIAGRILSGDLTVKIPEEKRKDEVGLLMQAFSSIGSFRQMMFEIIEAANLLTTSSSEILATTTQVASGSAETASAVSETTATVEEVKQTAQVANQKARHVVESTQKSNQASDTGLTSVENVIQGMHQIEEQMESIGENIVRLSEQGQAIGEIIASVNELAEQSNLLAVNAAIEAAKAGEHGKGFAVVAQEVKNLAEQSKQATAQVRAILGDIQKATGAAVMAAEQGNKAVQAGVKQSAETGESIRLLAENTGKAAQAAAQIAASSQQQLAGMDQVALAMENIKQASTQNMSGTRQAEVAAHNLHELGVKLQQLVSQYKI
ncbi:MAG: methyl-accepting chemotaxis protein [Gammaproteobacteria bacterium]